MSKINFTVEETHRNVHSFRHKRKFGFEQWYLLTADIHKDNPKTRDDLVIKHFDQAKERGAGIISIGDVFCAMQGKSDRRGSKESVRPENNKDDYFDSLVETTAEFFAPYANNMALVTEGNHETAIRKHQEISITNRLLKELKYNTGATIYKGGYSGFARFMFEGAGFQSVNLFYQHGSGGGGEVTKGTIKASRRAVYVPDADIVASGHIHESWYLEIPRHRISPKGKPFIDTQYHIQLPTYKEEYGDGFGGFHIEQGRPPKPLGAWWLRFYYEKGEVKFEFQRAS